MTFEIDPNLAAINGHDIHRSFSRLSQMRGTSIHQVHVVLEPRRSTLPRQCPGCYADSGRPGKHILDKWSALRMANDILTMLRLDAGKMTSFEFWFRADGIWHRQGGDEHILHVPFAFMSGHEVLKAHEEAGTDPSLACKRLMEIGA